MRFWYGIFSILLIIAGWAPSAPCAEFRDFLGRTITLEGEPKRIIPLAPSLTEILYSLGLGERVVGVTQFSSYPPEAAAKPKVGSYINLNVEAILRLRPDLIIATKDGNEPGVVDMLAQAGIAVFVVNPRNVQETIGTIGDIGRVCGIPERAGQLTQLLEKRLDNVVGKTALKRKPLVFLQINLKPIMTVNRHTFHHDLIRLSGGRNLTADASITYPRISIEEVIERRPDVILISSMERGGRYEKARQEWMKWTSIPAVRNGRVYLIDSDLIDRPSPRIIDGLEAMARLVHPDIHWN